MLIESSAHLPVGFAFLQDLFHAPSGEALARIGLRWFHFLAGVMWIGLLYFFNVVNVPFQKTLDADTKKKVNPELLGRSLWWFRWGAVVTVLAGLTYYAMYILASDVRLANNAGGHVSIGLTLLVWLLIPIVIFVIEFLIINKVAALTKDGRVFAVVVIVLLIVLILAIIKWFDATLQVGADNFASNKTYSIGIGGAMGLIMLLNVWGIIWPANKRILAGLQGGPPAAPELARRAFLASRTNAWMSLPMLFFMGTSHGDYIILGR
jgi:uncharacterized membrane protein